jgi:hypothetical protein
MRVFQRITFIFLFSIMCIISCEESPSVVDKHKNVIITNPLNGDIVMNQIEICAEVSDETDVSHFMFDIDGCIIGTDSIPPYSCTWYVWWWATDCQYTLSAKAYDSSGNLLNSDYVKVVVSLDALKGSGLESPGNNDVLSVTDTVEMVWNRLPGADRYTVFVFKDGLEPVFARETSDTAASVKLGVGSYDWGVCAENNNRCPGTHGSIESARYQFSIIAE